MIRLDGRFGLAFVGLGLLLSGCSAGSSVSEPRALGDEASVSSVAEFSDTTGAVEGTVTDVSLQPVANATLILSGSAIGSEPIANSSTDGEGRFAFSFLEPGTYRVRAEAPDFEPSASLVDVAAGVSRRVTLTLGDVPSQEPYSILLIKTGMQSCSAAVIVAPSGNSCTGNRNETNMWFKVPEGFQYLLSETDWSSSEELTIWYYVSNTTFSNVDRKILGAVWGLPVLRIGFFPNESYPTFDPVPTKPFLMQATSYYGGHFSKEVNWTAGPVCRYNIYGRCTGVGVTLGLRYTQYLTAFIYGLPEDYQSYSAVPDR